MNATAPFTVYRPTVSFFDAVNSDIELLNLHRQRTSYYKPDSLSASKEMLQRGLMKPAATVDVNSLDQLYTATNSITRNWTENPQITLTENAKDLFMYSTSVGDVVSDSCGNWFYCAPFGWVEIEPLIA